MQLLQLLAASNHNVFLKLSLGIHVLSELNLNINFWVQNSKS